MKYVIANWKMFGRKAFIADWCRYYSENPPSQIENIKSNVTAIVAPPDVYLNQLSNVLPQFMALAAQNVSIFAQDGAHTGETSAAMLHEAGCKYVLVGHSERRALEGSSHLLEKVQHVLDEGMIPVYCVGEPLEQRQAGEAQAFIQNQLATLKDIAHSQNVLLAYEPIWAIGTGQSAELDDIEEMHRFIKSLYPWPVLYGGSVKPENAKTLLNSSVIDGALVGGASLKPDAFLSIVEAAS